jgi:hypothetical protein
VRLRAADPRGHSLIAAGYIAWRAKHGLPAPASTSMSRSRSASPRCWRATPSPFLRAAIRAAGAGEQPRAPLLHARRQLRTRAYFRKFGSKVILVGRFTPGLRFTIFFTAGTLHVKPAVFFIYDFVAAAFSVPVLVYVAYVFGEQDRPRHQYARRTEHGILIAIVIAAIVVGSS